MDLTLILNRLSVLEARLATLENPEPQDAGDRDSAPAAEAAEPRAEVEAVNPFLQRHPRTARKQDEPLGSTPKTPRSAPTTQAASHPKQAAATGVAQPQKQVSGFDEIVRQAVQREVERNPSLRGDWVGNVTKEVDAAVTESWQANRTPQDMQFPQQPTATQSGVQRSPVPAAAQPVPAAAPRQKQPATFMQSDTPLIVNPTPLAQSMPKATAPRQEIEQGTAVDVSWLKDGDKEPQPKSVSQAESPSVPPDHQPRSQSRGNDPTEQIRQWREDMAPVEAAKQAWRPATELQEVEPRDPHLRDVPGQDFPQYETDVPDLDLAAAKRAVNRQARAATVAERQRRVQENAVERQTERRNRIQQGRNGLPADERTPEEKFNEALEVARQRSSLHGEARQRFDRQHQRQQQASEFDSGKVFEGSNQFVPPRAHEAIPTRPGRETDGLPHETFGKSVVDATKASTRAMERLSGELGEALARIEKIERDIEMRGHA